nr:vacuolar protein [Cryptococcus depauperatus CBS 7855]
MCCEADWKREVVPDHKFDFINVREFHQSDIWTRIKYVFRYIFLLKSVTVYALDIFTAVTMITSDHWTNSVTSKCDSECAVEVKFQIAKWVFVGCIIFSFLLASFLGYETYKAKKVIESRDISYAFTNLLANDYYSFRSYDNFCLFCQIESSTKKKDSVAFFIFFTFKDWKRLILADGPRQSINGILLYSFAAANHFQTSNIPAYWDNSPITAMLLFSMILTVLIFAGSFILLVIAAVGYIPLLCYIQGNLKEYICHKVDKRITELIKKKTKQRVARAAAIEKRARVQGSGKGGFDDKSGGAWPEPTLPQISLDDDENNMMRAKIKTEQTGLVPPGTKVYTQEVSGLDYPPTPAGIYQPGSLAYQEDYGSLANLTANAGPMGISYPPTATTNQSTMAPYSASVLSSPYSYSPNPPLSSSNSARPSFPPTSNSSSSLSQYDHLLAHSSGRISPSYTGRESPSYPSQHAQPQHGYNNIRRDSGGSGSSLGQMGHYNQGMYQGGGGTGPTSQSPYGYNGRWR